MEWETVCDSVEQAFTVELPRGWKNRAWLARLGPALHNIAEAVSPDGATTMFLGEPRLPYFTDPAFMGFMPSPGTALRPFTSIEHFLPSYARDRFGHLPGLRPLGMIPCPELFRIVVDRAARSGIRDVRVTAGQFSFEYSSEHGPTSGLLFGSTIGFGAMWWVEILGITTRGEPLPHVPALFHMFESRQATPAMLQRQMQEREASAAAHRATMAGIEANGAILRSNHQANMANLANMAASHQQHMATLHQSHDQANAAWRERQRASDDAWRSQMPSPQTSDDGQRQFLNMIAEERTVVDPNGDTHQVADGYDRYFRRRSDGTFIGTRDDRDLAGLPGVDPAEYDELKIKR